MTSAAPYHWDMETGFTESKVFIVGVGLIGGSLGAALRQRFPALQVTGVGRNLERLNQAVDRGILTDVAPQLTKQLLKEPCVVVLCTPVHIIEQQLSELADICSECTLITDGGSVKASIAEVASRYPSLKQTFVGAHPIAGGEKSGFEHAQPNLFEDRLCVLTPQDSKKNLIERAQNFWSAVGCRCEILTPEEHDRILGMTSHLPHVVAALLASIIRPEILPFAGSGFLDTTRVAAGDPNLWTSILKGNCEPVVDGLQQFEAAARSFREALQEGRFEEVTSLLSRAAEIRRAQNDQEPV